MNFAATNCFAWVSQFEKCVRRVHFGTVLTFLITYSLTLSLTPIWANPILANPFLANPFLAKSIFGQSISGQSIFGSGVCHGGAPKVGPRRWGPEGGARKVGCLKFRAFFPLPQPFRSFCLSLGVLSWNLHNNRTQQHITKMDWPEWIGQSWICQMCWSKMDWPKLDWPKSALTVCNVCVQGVHNGKTSRFFLVLQPYF